jgi:hypothetical protein
MVEDGGGVLTRHSTGEGSADPSRGVRGVTPGGVTVLPPKR